MIVEELMVPLSDGARMRTIICRPEEEGIHPVLFMRTPYPQLESEAKKSAESATKRGYTYVFQFCRGTGGSEGTWIPNVNERKDGMDSLRWLSDCPWCEWIGVHGISYMALIGWIVADILPEKVKGLFLCHYGIDRHLSAYKDGLFRHDILTGWAMSNAGKKVTDNFENDYLKACLFRPHYRVDETLWGVRLDWYRDWITNIDHSAAYWQTGLWKQLREIPSKVRVPTCIVAGWYDHHLEGTVLAYEKLDAGIKKKSRLIIGAWTHDFIPSVPAHPARNAGIDIDTTMMDWFDGLSGKGEGCRPGVLAYVVGEDEWRMSDRWPLPASGRKTLHLTSIRDSDPVCFRLSDARPIARETVIEYDYDPNDPVRSRGGETLFVSEKLRGSVKQEKPGARSDVITFVSEPLTESVPVCGKITVTLFVDSDAADTCFTVKLSEILPNGDAYNIRSGMTTLAYRNGRTERGNYRSGDVVEIVLEALPITWTIGKGSGIRLDVSSSNFPEYSIHSNYPGIWSLQEKTKKARQTLHFGAGYEPRIEIPIFRKT